MSDGYNSKRKQQRKWTMNLGIWNIQGIRNKQKEVIMEFIQRHIDIAILSETKKKGNGIENNNDFIHLYTGVRKDERARAGVSILIHKKLKKYIKSWEPMNERIIKLTIQIRGRIMTILGVYAPNNDAAVLVKDTFEETLRDIIDQIPRSHEIIIGGDLNGRVGRQRHSNVVGKHGEEALNDNGERLINLCNQFDLKISNTFFAHKDIHKYTWYQQTRGLKSIIDYLIVRQNSQIKIQDVRVKRGAECGSDHRLLQAKIYIPFLTSYSSNTTDSFTENRLTTTTYNLKSFDYDSTKYLYSRRLDQKLIVTQRTIEEEYEHIKTCILEAADESVGKMQRNNKPEWWDEKIEQQIKEKKELYQKLLQKNDEVTRQKYKRANREVKNEVLRKKNQAWEKKCEHIEHQLGGTRSSEAWKTIKSVRTSAKQGPNLGNITNKDWVQHFKDLLEERRHVFIGKQHQIQNLTHIDLQLQQVQQAVKDTKMRKSPGPGGIHPEFIKYGPEKLTRMLMTMFQRCINGEETPTEWRTSYISTIYKKGSKNDPKNYRGIAVIPTIGRIYSRILKNLIEEDIEDKQAEEQAGFRAGRSTTDNLFTLKIALEKRTQRNRETHIAFIDLEKAYDSVPVSQLWKEMEKIEIRPTLIRAVQLYYEQNTAAIKIGTSLTESFQTTKGLRQGCCLSPTLFKLYLDQSLKGWTRKCRNMGLQVGDDILYTLYFADDQIVVAEDQQDLSYMVRKLQEEYSLAGLTINLSKCEYLAVGSDENDNLPLEIETIKSVEKVKYLGVIFNKLGNSKDEIQTRITRGRQIIGALNSILWERKIRRETKLRIYNSIVKSVLTYGSEVWDLNSTNRRKLLATEMDFLRRSCRRSRLERIRNIDIKRNMNIERDILDDIERKQLIWFGHTKRMNETRWPRKVLEWVPPERRKRGRPRRSWRDGVNEAMETRRLQEDMCHDRRNWKLGTERRRQP